MSRHPSPGPSHSHPAAHISQHVAPTRQKSKAYSMGIAAGAEDVKYQAKYKDLKRKVKEIEGDNDKLHFKVLQAKRSIQRMKLERAVLYERLAAVPPSPDIHDRQALPPIHPGPGIPPLQPSSRQHAGLHQHRDLRDHPSSMEPDHNLVEYIRTHGNPRVAPGPDGRPVPVLDTPMGPGMAPSSHLSAIHSPRRASGNHDSSRHLVPLSQLPQVQHLEIARGHAHNHSHSSPLMHPAHAGSSHERTRSQSSSRSRNHQAPASYQPGHIHPQQYPEGLPPVQHVLHSPPLSERERSRRHDVHELAQPHGDHHHGHQHSPLSQLSPPMHPSDVRSSSRIHGHQRIPSAYANREEQHERGREHRELDRERERERERDRDRERDWEREREHERLGRGREMSQSHLLSPPSGHRPRHPSDRGDYQDHHASSRPRDEQGYYHDIPATGGYSRGSRSGTPGSGSGSGSGIGGVEGPSRPDSRTQFYDHDRARSYRLRPVNQPNEEADFVHEDGRSQSRDRNGGGGGNFPPPEQSRPSLDSRKRTRDHMEDVENDVGEGPPGGGAYSSGRVPDDRGSKRYHREHLRRGADNQEDDRMGPL